MRIKKLTECIIPTTITIARPTGFHGSHIPMTVAGANQKEKKRKETKEVENGGFHGLVN